MSIVLRLSPAEDDIAKALGDFLEAATTVEVGNVIQGQENRVPEPTADDFIVFWPLRRRRLATNVDTYADCRFIGSVALTVLTVASVQLGTIALGRWLFGTGVATGTVILSQLSGTPGGAGTYSLSLSQTIASEVMASGSTDLMQEVEVTYQVDVHGPNAQDNATTLSTILRDEVGVGLFGGPTSPISPLHADEPRFVPFYNENQQVEHRWVVEAVLQANQTVTVPQQFAEVVVVGLINVDADYPP